MSVRILLVDDDANNRELMAELLTGEGYTVDACEGPSEALLALSSQAYDFLLTDYVMPVMNGLELTRRARALDATLRCFVVTGQPRLATFDLGPAVWISKPVDFDELLIAMKG